MGKVNTVFGPIATEALGIAAMHEHIGFGLPESDLDTQWWNAPEEAFDVTVEKLRRFREHGGKTFVDCTGIGNGRDVNISKPFTKNRCPYCCCYRICSRRLGFAIFSKQISRILYGFIRP